MMYSGRCPAACMGINRNILECKVVSVQPLLTFSNSINRNILECKDSHQSMEGPKRRLVLIETYWNVKFSNRSYVIPFITVLIETYWNVNLVAVLFIFVNLSINRNILECKEH